MSEPVVSPPPVEIRVARFVCPFCRRSWSRRPRSVAHIALCWRNPAVRGCKTCAFFRREIDIDGGEEWCERGVDLLEGLPVGCDKWKEVGGDV